MTDSTARLALPLLSSGQAEKEIFHNEALVRLDALVQPAVEAVALNDPPTAPSAGQCWIVGGAPTGAWAGQPQALAVWCEDGWRFAAPSEGMSAWSIADQVRARFDGVSWRIGELRANRIMIGAHQVVAAQQPAVADPAGGTVVDAEVRAAVSAILAAMRNHGLIAS